MDGKVGVYAVGPLRTDQRQRHVEGSPQSEEYQPQQVSLDECVPEWRARDATDDTTGGTHKQVDGAGTAAHGVCSEDEGAENRWADCRVVHERAREQRVVPDQEQEVVVNVGGKLDAFDDGSEQGPRYHRDQHTQDGQGRHFVWHCCWMIDWLDG